MPALLSKLLPSTTRKFAIIGHQQLKFLTTTSKPQDPSFGMLFDIDGVLLRGKKPIPAAVNAFKKLVNNEKFRVPTVFVTNAGNCLRQHKADQLSDVLNVKIQPEQVMLSHSPLKMFTEYHNKCVLLSGQGPVEEIAKNIGFTNYVTIEMIRKHFPNLDMVDHQRRPVCPSVLQVDTFPKIDAIILFGEPVRWETNLQLLVDVLLTNGNLNGPINLPSRTSRHLPILACNMDLQWMSESHMPRFAHGMFMHCLESVYLKLTGQQLNYTALMGKPSEITYYYAEQLIKDQAKMMGLSKPINTLYAVGDNPMADIYGANLYNRKLQEENRKSDVKEKKVCHATAQLHSAQPWRQVHANMRSMATSASDERSVTSNPADMIISKPSKTRSLENCHSILVCTGVYSHSNEGTTYDIPPVFHGPRDMEFDVELCKPTMITQDVESAVETVYQLEKFK